MKLLPAIDLMGGRVVRLRQGKKSEQTVYGDEPAVTACKWEKAGGDWLHLVDLDGAFEGVSKNMEAVREITAAVSIPCELGGGMRSEAAIEQALKAGISRVVIGTKACENPEFAGRCVQAFGAGKIAVGIDALEGEVSLRGWTQGGGVKAVDLARRMQEQGVQVIIYTDIKTDGMLTGPNMEALREMRDAVEVGVIASGGVSSEEDVRELHALGGLHGVIIGKALYEGRVNLENLRDLST